MGRRHVDSHDLRDRCGIYRYCVASVRCLDHTLQERIPDLLGQQTHRSDVSSASTFAAVLCSMLEHRIIFALLQLAVLS